MGPSSPRHHASRAGKFEHERWQACWVHCRYFLDAFAMLVVASPFASGLAAPMRAPMIRAVVGPALRPAYAAPARGRASVFRMAEETASIPEQAVCIETGEEVEECTLIEWKAGKLSAPADLVEKGKLGACASPSPAAPAGKSHLARPPAPPPVTAWETAPVAEPARAAVSALRGALTPPPSARSRRLAYPSPAA